MKRTYKHWSTKEDRELLLLRNQGKKYREIATKLDRTTLSVEKRYRKIIKEGIYDISSLKIL